MVSPICLVSSVALFNVFRYMNAFVFKSVNFLASCTFGVYLFHTNKLICDDLWIKFFNMVEASEISRLWIIRSILAAFTIFGITLLLTMIKILISKITYKIDNRILVRLNTTIEKSLFARNK